MDTSVERGSLRVRTASMAVLGGAVVVYVLRLAGPLLVPLLVALLLSYALEPVVAMLVRRRVPRTAAAAAAFFLLAVLAGSVGRSAGVQLSSFLDDLPRALADVNARGDRRPGRAGTLARIQEAAAELSAGS